MLKLYSYKRFISRYGGLLLKLILALFWCLGLWVGYSIAAKTSLSVLMRTISLERVSFVGLVIAAVFPLLISALTVQLSVPSLILPIAFFKASLFGYCVTALSFVYADAGWLARWLYIFLDSFMLMFLLWFWIRNITGKSRSFRKDLAICFFAASLLVCIDYFIVSPFSVMLFNYS